MADLKRPPSVENSTPSKKIRFHEEKDEVNTPDDTRDLRLFQPRTGRGPKPRKYAVPKSFDNRDQTFYEDDMSDFDMIIPTFNSPWTLFQPSSPFFSIPGRSGEAWLYIPPDFLDRMCLPESAEVLAATVPVVLKTLYLVKVESTCYIFTEDSPQRSPAWVILEPTGLQDILRALRVTPHRERDYDWARRFWDTATHM